MNILHRASHKSMLPALLLAFLVLALPPLASAQARQPRPRQTGAPSPWTWPRSNIPTR